MWPDAPLERNAVAVLRFIEATPGSTKPQICRAMDLRESTIQHHLFVLKQGGYIERSDGRRYGLAHFSSTGKRYEEPPEPVIERTPIADPAVAALAEAVNSMILCDAPEEA